MRVIAEERKQNTDKLLYSLPLSSMQIISAKYLAMIVVFLIPLAVISLYPVILSRFGAVSLITCYSTLFAFFMIGAAMLAVGLFMSSLTDNQIIAAIFTFTAIVSNYFLSSYASDISGEAQMTLIIMSSLIAALGIILYIMTRHVLLSVFVTAVLEGILACVYLLRTRWLEGLIYQLVMGISAFKRLNSFVNDLFDLSAIVFYLTVAALFVYFSIVSFEKRRWS